MDTGKSSAGANDRGPLPIGSHSVSGIEISAVKKDFSIVLSQIVG
jgi:hypothetical protein